MGLKGSGSHERAWGGTGAGAGPACARWSHRHRGLAQGPGSQQELGSCFVPGLWTPRPRALSGRWWITERMQGPGRTPSTWSTCSPAARRLSRKVSLQAPRVSVPSRPAPPCCRPGLRSSSQTRTKSARNHRDGGRAGIPARTPRLQVGSGTRALGHSPCSWVSPSGPSLWSRSGLGALGAPAGGTGQRRAGACS